ncbi:MAG: alpha/beta hydrolase-fold protein [Planctomycetaceae bacterium]
MGRQPVQWMCLVLMGFAVVCGRCNAADDGKRGFIEKVLKDDAGEHKYVVFLPQNYSPIKSSPVMLFLHGAGERGTDGRAHLNVGLGALVKARESNFPAIVVFPQCENTRGRVLQGWQAGTADADRALKILEQVEQDYRIDPKRRILTGWSMGGFGAWSIAAADPSRWSALVPMAGGAQTEWAEKLKDLPTWVWHGDDDHAVLVNRSREMVEALKTAGASPRFTEIPGGDHESWRVGYADDRLISWMLDPANVDPDKLPAPKETLAPKQVFVEPFTPALEIPGAMYARLGNQMLEAVAYSAPKQIPPNLLTGRINDIVDSTNVEGYAFRIQFSGISYNSQLNQIRVKGVAKDRLNLQIGLSNATMTIGNTWVTGEDHSASAGAIQVVMGHRRPVWLDIDVQPYVENRRIRLKPIASRFEIPNDNWYVTAPAGVSVRGFGMTRDKVSSGLVSGLYGQKQRISREVQSAVPKMIEAIEQKMSEFGEAGTFADRFWPIPVYKPRTRVYPQDISTDENGITLILGLSAAAIDRRNSPSQPAVVDLKTSLPGDLPTLKSLQVGLTPGVLEPLTELLVKADVGRIHLLDIPENTFAKLADRAALTEAIPEFKRHENMELWSELSLAGGIGVTDQTETAGQTRVQFHAPKLLITTSLRKDSKGFELTPIAVFEIDLKQNGFAELVKPDSQTRGIRFGWDGDPQFVIKCRFADGYQAADPTINSDLIDGWVRECWKAWTGLSPVATANVPDLDFGVSKIRLSNAGWASPHIFATFTPPGVKVTNLSDVNFIYETKGPYSEWSNAKYKLEPGKSHEFDISYPLTYRRDGEIYTLAPGSHSEFRVPITGGTPRLFQARDTP